MFYLTRSSRGHHCRFCYSTIDTVFFIFEMCCFKLQFRSFMEENIQMWQLMEWTSDKCIDNIHTLPANINLFVLALQSGRKANLWSTFTTCFAATANKFLHLPIMYIYCVYPAMLKKSITSAKLSENCWNKRCSNRFQWYPLWSPRL